MGDIGSVIKNPNFLLKLLAMILVLVGMLMWACKLTKTSTMIGDIYTFGSYYDFTVIVTTTYLVVLPTFIIVYCMGETKKMFEILFVGTGIILLIIDGILELVDSINYSGNWACIVMAICILFAGVILIVDLIIYLKQ